MQVSKPNYKNSLAILGSFILIFSASKNTSVNGLFFNLPIGGDLLSTLRLVFRLCYIPGNHSEQIATPFFACYDQAPGKTQFVTCQTRIFGNPLDTDARIGASCKNPFNLIWYARCLQGEFQAAGIDMQNAVNILNMCQGRVLGFTG